MPFSIAGGLLIVKPTQLFLFVFNVNEFWVAQFTRVFLANQAKLPSEEDKSQGLTI